MPLLTDSELQYRRVIGGRFRSARLAAGMSAFDVTTKLIQLGLPGIQNHYIARFERGDQHISVHSLKNIAKAIGADFAELVREEPTCAPPTPEPVHVHVASVAPGVTLSEPQIVYRYIQVPFGHSTYADVR